MVWIYEQATGRLFKVEEGSDTLVGIGYAGNGRGLNSPSHETIPNCGPLPRGYWTMLPARRHARLGRLAIELRPDHDTMMYGRSGFWIHGDNKWMNHTASDGCIILTKHVRQLLAREILSGNDLLRVVVGR